MFRTALKLALAATAVWAVWSFVPVHGRTMAERWRGAGNLAAFLERGFAEARGAFDSESRPPKKQLVRQKPAVAQRPTERHTEADRRAVERILADRISR